MFPSDIWFERAKEMAVSREVSSCFREVVKDHISIIFARLLEVSNLLMNSWSHPSKKINHLIPTTYQRLVDFVSDLEGDLHFLNNYDRC